jgi:hypothetical protein
MIPAPFVGLSLLLTVATGPITDPTGPDSHLSERQKQTAMQPYLRSATECVAKAVAADPRFTERKSAGDFGDLIVDSMPGCAIPVRAMIGAYDRYFGDGTGEAYFMGPYLDELPVAVGKWVQQISAK